MCQSRKFRRCCARTRARSVSAEAEASGAGLRLNGEALALRIWRAAPAFTLEEMLSRVHDALAAGANLLCPEGPVDPRLLDLCDEAGLLARAGSRGNHPCRIPREALPEEAIRLMEKGDREHG